LNYEQRFSYNSVMADHHDSLWALQQFLRTWVAGARNPEIEHLIVTLKEELRHRGDEFRCKVTRRSS